jgi:hypothetical protein
MKRKYSGLITAIIMTLTLLLTVSYGIWESGKKMNGIQIKRRITPLPVISVPSISVINEMERLEHEMDALIKPREGDKSRVDLSLFGYQPVTMGGHTLRTTTGESISTDYVLTLAFVSGKRRFCIIDDVFYEEGNNLPDGAEIVRIESSRVMVKSRNIMYWVPLTKKEVTPQKESK